jgi:hypothetical protein
MPNQILVEIGKSGIRWNSGYLYDEFLPQLQGRRGIQIYREMSENDSIIGACLYAIEQTMREMRWSVMTPKGRSGKQLTSFLSENMKGMTHSWNDMVGDILSMLRYGWAYFEIVYRRDRKGRILWHKIALRKQDSMDRWELDDNGSILGMVQNPAPTYQFFFIPIQKSLLFRTKLDADNPEGKSILRTAYHDWYYKKNLEEIEAIGCERDLAGIPILTLPDNFNFDGEKEKQQLDAAKRLVANLRRDEQDGVVLPFGWKLELLSSPGKRQFNTTEIINRYNKSIASSVLAEFILLGMERTGSYALSKDLTDMFFLCLEGWADSICSVFNRFAIPNLFRFNGVTGKDLPYIVHTRLSKPDLNTLSNFVSKLAPGVSALDIDEDVKRYLKNVARLSEYTENPE